MGITGELVKSVFSRNKPATSQESSVMSNGARKKKWNSVGSYLCGKEFSSVNSEAEADSASVNSSKATITQPLPEQSIETKENIPNAENKSMSKLFHEENAAIIIQSTFRDYLARRRSNEIQSQENNHEVLAVTETDSPGRNPVGTSIEVQTGNSVEVLSVPEESVMHYQASQKVRALVFRIKEDWDDSTVSSNISKRRIQNRLEAMTRRERALAYAFSQQLRICSKKRQKPDGTEPNMGWSWLERWMATRLPESLPVESKQQEQSYNNQKFELRKSYFDMAVEEQESCGSNEVSVHLDHHGLSTASPEERNNRKDCSKESEQDSKLAGSKKEIKSKNVSDEK